MIPSRPGGRSERIKMPSIEYQILIAACDLNPDQSQLETLRRLTARNIDAELLLALAVREGLAGLLYRNFQRAGVLEKLGREHHRRLESLYHQTAAFNLKLINDLKKILQKADSDNIPVVLLQGIALLEQVYADVGLRPLTDIDLWILPRFRESFADCLLQAGCRQDPVYPNTFRMHSTIIDIHTHILWAERIRTRRLLLAKGQESFFDNARSMNVEGESALCLDPCDQALYLTLHALKHNLGRLVWLVDIKSLISDWGWAEWKGFTARARFLGLEKMAAMMVIMMKDLLNYQPPSEVKPLIRVQNTGFFEKALLRRRRENKALPSWAQLYLLSAGKALSKRLVFVMENAFPRPQVLRQVFAGSPNLKTWQLYWKRGLQLLGFRHTF